MQNTVVAIAFFILYCNSTLVDATDFRCDSSPKNIASRPPELKAETMLATITRSPAVGAFAIAGLHQSFSHSNFGTSVLPFGVARSPLVMQMDRNRTFEVFDGLPRMGLSEPGSRKTLPDPFGEWGGVVEEFNPVLPLVDTRGRRPPQIVDRPISPSDGFTSGELNRPSQNESFNVLRDAFHEQSVCTAQATQEWFSADSDVRASSSIPVTKLVQEFLADRVKFQNEYKVDFTDMMASYIQKTQELLNRCFTPAESTAFEKKHGVLKQLGQIMLGDVHACTGTLIGDERYLITARHCFKDIDRTASGLSQMWFKPALSLHRYQICAIAEDDALAADKFSNINDDQVLVRIASTSIKPVKIKPVSPNEVRTTTDEKIGIADAPTLLTNISYFPLSPLVLPSVYTSGFVQSKTSICAAIEKADACFSHICSVVEGGSGSPIFLANGQELALAGTHVGSSNDGGQDCRQQSGSISNSAVLVKTSNAPIFFSNAAK